MNKLNCFLIAFLLCFQLSAGKKNKKPHEYQIDISELPIDSELPLHLDPHSTNDRRPLISLEKFKTIGQKLSPVLPYIIVPGAYLTYKYFTSTQCDPDSEEQCNLGNEFTLQNIGDDAFGLIGGSYLMANLFSNKAQRLTSIFSRYLPPFMRSENDQKILQYQQAITKAYKQGSLSKENKGVCERIICDYYRSLEGGDTASAKRYLSKLEKISRLPKKVKKLVYTQIKPELEKLLETYSPDIEKKITHLVEDMVVSSRSLKPKKTIICFYGPPGTGKTSLAKKLGTVLDLPITAFKASSPKAEKLISQNGAPDDESELMLDMFTLEGDNFKNNILFVDEFVNCLNPQNRYRDAFRNFFVSICEKEEQFYESGTIYGLTIDMSSAIIILACNELPQDLAIMDRIEIIEFKDTPKDKQFSIALQTFEEGLRNYEISQPISAKDKEVLELIVEKNKFPGARILKSIVDKYILHRARCLYLDKIDYENFDVDFAYESYNREK